MWLLILASLFNAWANQTTVINRLRLSAIGVPIGIIEVLTAALLLYALVFGGSISRVYPNRRTHPMYVFILIALVTALTFGCIESAVNQVPMETMLRRFRELASWPIFLVVGYRLVASPRSLRAFLITVVIGASLTSFMLLSHFGSETDVVEVGDNFNMVRTVAFFPGYCGLAAMTMVFAAVAGVRFVPKILAFPLACIYLAAEASPLHRVEWLAIMGFGAGLLLLVPKGKRVSTGLAGVVALGLLIGGLAIAVNVVSRITQRDFNTYVSDRIDSMLPTKRETSTETKAWDTRLYSTWEELRIWRRNPLTGMGIAIQDGLVIRGQIPNWGAFHHNGWSAILAQMGVIGFIAYIPIPFCMIFIGRKLALQGADRTFRLIGAMGFFGGIYGIAMILGSGMWLIRVAMLIGVICGMLFRCLDMEDAVLAENKINEIEHEQSAEELFEHVPAGF